MMRSYRIALALALIVFACGANSAAPKTTTAKINQVLLPSRSPLVSFRILFNTGSAADPRGKEGLATLTAQMISNGGSKSMTRAQILDAMYPMATGFGSQVDKEMTVFFGTTHLDNLDKYYSLVRQVLLEPGFREDDFQRVKTDLINYLKVSLRANNDEELGKEHLYNMIYPAYHTYGHVNAGTISSLEKLTINDVRVFYAEHYTQANLVLGLAGAYPANFPQRVVADFAQLAAGKAASLKVTTPKQDAGMKIDILQRETRSTAISLGFPIPVNRSHKDYAALALVASYFGQHRSSNGYLFQRIREQRGLNYGDYAYVEYFPEGMFRFEPAPNLGRSSQIFQIWIRPVEPQNGLFTLRAALFEYDKLVRGGMAQEAFDGTREFLRKYVNVVTATQDAQLGYALDSRYYGTPEFTRYMRDELEKLTLADVNHAIRAYLKSDAMRVAIVTKDAKALRDVIVAGTPSPITYVSPKPKEVLDEDKLIEKYTIAVKDTDVRLVPVDTVFQ